MPLRIRGAVLDSDHLRSQTRCDPRSAPRDSEVDLQAGELRKPVVKLGGQPFNALRLRIRAKPSAESSLSLSLVLLVIDVAAHARQ
jgi:hypothetical protein